jgi:tetratricopeptide (TPR) repeat protein
MEQPVGEKGIVYGQVLGDWGTSLCMLGHRKEGLPLTRKSQVILRRLNALAELAFTNNVLGFITSDPVEAKICLQDSLTYYKNVGARWGIAMALTNLGLIVSAEGAFEDAERYYREAMEINRELNDRRGKTWVLYGLGDLAYKRGAYVKAKEYFLECYTISNEIGNNQYLRNSISRLADIARLTGEYDEADSCYQKSLNIAREAGDAHAIAWSTVALGANARSAGAYEDALVLYQQALKGFLSLDNSLGLSVIYTALGSVILALGDKKKAHHYTRLALKVGIETPHDELYLPVLTGSTDFIEASGMVEGVVEFVALVNNYPHGDVSAREQSQAILNQLKLRLSPAAFAAAMERGSALGAEAAALALLEDLRSETVE